MSRRAPARSEAAAASADEELVERARSGDADARERLVRRYLPEVYRTTARVLGDPDLAQDAAQDAFVNAMGGLSRFRGDASFRTWLLRIAINAARSVGRRNGRRREVSLVLAEAEPARGPDPAGHAVNVTEVERAERALDGLPPKQRMAVALRVQQGLSYAEIAGALKCSEGAARVNYHLGVKRLREMLK
ncbi:MAG: sigma-70 family RNA polymerase sigma factor [Gemmatimonadetes bacterium]|nr:sigma-70 family RNA polymerase sigma factor [Gemmatimonadota bacterium]